MNIKKLSDLAKIPTRGSTHAAGYDLYTVESYTLQPMERKAFKTDISMAIPVGLYGKIAPRSGLAIKKGIEVMGGIIDSDYRGEILVILVNLGSEPLTVNVHDKVAQLIFSPYTTPSFTEVDDLDVTERNANGFGSTDTPVAALSELYKKLKPNPSPRNKYTDLIKEREQ